MTIMKNIAISPILLLAGFILFSNCGNDDDISENLCPDCPKVSSLSPNFGWPGDTVTISGYNFNGLTSVAFEGQNAIILGGATATQVRVVVPDIGRTGAADVVIERVFQSPGGGASDLTSDATVYTYAPARPVISSISPASGFAGAAVTITGEHFGNLKAVRFAGVEAQFTISGDQKVITATAPAVSITGLVDVLVVTQFSHGGAQRENPSDPGSFSYEGSIGITSFSPTTGRRGDLITISGYGFGNNAGAVEVRFNGKSAEVVAVSDISIQAKVPTRAGSGTVTVIKSGITANSPLPFLFIPTYTVSTLASNLGGEPTDIDFFNGRIMVSSSSKLFSITLGAVTEILTCGGIGGGGFRPSDGSFVFTANNCQGQGIKLQKIPQGSNSVSLFANISLFTLDIAWLDNDHFFASNLPVIALQLLYYQVSSGTFTILLSTTFADNGDGVLPAFGGPNGVAIRDGQVYIVEDRRVRLVVNNTVTTLTGNSNEFGYIDGPLAQARFNALNGIAVDDSGKIYVADQNNHCIRMIDLVAGEVSTIAGTNIIGSTDGDGSNARFYEPQGICLDNEGNLLVADHVNKAVRKITIE
jgi:hypothetical protein